MNIRDDAGIIIRECIAAVLPEMAVIRALNQLTFSNDLVLVAIGKAAWNMAKAAKDTLGNKLKKGIVVTKYKHSKGHINNFEIIEAGHPIPDENSVLGAKKALDLVANISPDTEILFLISGGGSALFEKPLDGVVLKDIINITQHLLSCGADIVEINTIRKHLSAVKGGRFAQKCCSSKIHTIVLSDVVGDKLDSIASGPTYPDSSTSQQAIEILNKYDINISNSVLNAIKIETPKKINNCEAQITGNVSELCKSAAKSAKKLGYTPLVLSTSLECEAKEAGKLFSSIAREICNNELGNFIPKPPCAIIAGGETIVKLKGVGKGGRNQETALSAALGIVGLEDVVIFSLGSDGTDGPTDAAGGMVDGESTNRMKLNSINPIKYLEDNNSYYALKASGDLIFTGATGTNVNDIVVLLCKKPG
jgi:glycerate 2-kinase